MVQVLKEGASARQLNLLAAYTLTQDAEQYPERGKSCQSSVLVATASQGLPKAHTRLTFTYDFEVTGCRWYESGPFLLADTNWRGKDAV